MAITTYAELKTAIANWVDHANLGDRVDEFIDLAEARMNDELRVRRMLTRTYETISSEFVSLPTGWLGMRNLDYTSGGIRYSLKYETPEWMDRQHDGGTGQPRAYTILGSEIQLWPAPDTSYRLDWSYWKAITALSDADTTNWVLTNHPDLYLFGAGAEANKYLKNIPEYKNDLARFGELLKRIQRADKRDKYSGAALQVRVA